MKFHGVQSKAVLYVLLGIDQHATLLRHVFITRQHAVCIHYSADLML